MGWHRFHTPPRRAFRGATLTKLTPRGQWLYDRSLARYNATPDGIEMARLGRTSIVTGEIGTIESLRFIMPKTLPEPAGMGSAQEISMRADVALEMLRRASDELQRNVVKTMLHWQFAREVSARRARKLRKRGAKTRFSRWTENGKARYLWVEPDYIAFL